MGFKTTLAPQKTQALWLTAPAKEAFSQAGGAPLEMDFRRSSKTSKGTKLTLYRPNQAKKRKKSKIK
jgi:hypothetical protein